MQKNLLQKGGYNAGPNAKKILLKGRYNSAKNSLCRHGHDVEKAGKARKLNVCHVQSTSHNDS
jgi:hypothetical protein